MMNQSATAATAEAEYQQIYFNNYLTGTLLLPVGKALVHTFGIFFYFVIVSLVLIVIPLGFLLDWQNVPARISEQWQQGNVANLFGLALIGLLGTLGLGLSLQMLIKTWTRFFRIVRARLYFATGQPLEVVEGLPKFSGGRRSLGRTTGKPPDTLEVSGMRFDLNHCSRLRELLKVATRNFVGTEALPSGIAAGFTLRVPLRVWFVPSTGVLARVDIQLPGQKEILERAQMLSQGLADWYSAHKAYLSEADIAKTQKLSDELGLLRTKLTSDVTAAERQEAEDRLATLEDWLSALDIHIPDE